MTYNYRFFYSNEFTDGNNSVIIIKSEDEPKYITMNNFIIDDEVYKEKFGDIEFLEDLGNFLGYIFNKKDKTQNTIDYIDKSIKIVQILVEDNIDSDLYIKGGQILIHFFTNYYNKQLEKFQKHVQKKIEEKYNEKDIDKYFVHIGNNFYVKNYIGFQSVEDINKFLNFDYPYLYKKRFPNYASIVFAIISLILLFLAFIFDLFILFQIDFNHRFFIVSKTIFFTPITIGFLTYSIFTYFKVNKSKNLEELKSIKSDEFINNFINEYIDKIQKKDLILCSIYIISSSIFIYIVSLILYYIILKKYSYK